MSSGNYAPQNDAGSSKLLSVDGVTIVRDPRSNVRLWWKSCKTNLPSLVRRIIDCGPRRDTLKSNILKMPSSSKNKRKRKDERRPAQVKKPRLDDGTSHELHATLQAERSLQRFRAFVHTKMKHSDTFVYMPFKENFGEDIRVLIIEPGTGDDPICCKLVPSTMTNIPFTALSYFWGEGEPIHEIYVTNYKTADEKVEQLSREEDLIIFMRKNKRWEGPSGKIYVRSNLFAALQRFRHRKKEMTMWIDALCIDQNDDDERSAQVKKMHELYLHAKNVCVWLGDGTGEDAPDPKHCFQFLQKMLDLKNLERLFSRSSEASSDLVEDADNIVSLMRNKWFSRRWVLQELALARNAEVVYGEYRMLWSDFADAIAIFIKNQDKINPLLSKRYMENADYLADVAAVDGVKNLGANALVDFTNNLFRRSENGDIQQRMMTLEVLVSSLLAFEATNPRDTIYAVLSLAKDTHSENKRYLDLDEKPSPDYKRKSLLDVYGDFIDYCISKSLSLDILLRHWAPTLEEERRNNLFSHSAIPSAPGEIRDAQEELPSWIPLIQKSSYGTPAQRIHGRSNGDSFVGVSHRTGHRNYSATSDLKPEYRFGFKPQDASSGTTLKRVFDGHLFIKGLRIGTVKEFAQRASHAMIFREAFQIAGFDLKRWNGHKEWALGVPRVPEGFWRTIVADRGPNGLNPPSWYPRACMDCLNHLRPGGDLSTKDVIALPNASRIVRDFLGRVKDVIWERKFARVKLGGPKRDTYGLVPAETREGDLICVLLGASVPVVLRKQKKDGKQQFIMVGECFIYGMMEGEAVSGKSWKSKAKYFELV
ncbi:heterokaryon incompatibility protein-domain-containing protein [Annulohypoxylon truncatum]|uniref:heterokaryon incompatibility protein-domain-containing protein n=1 Tax=Annulohypoxylon truncatum TaxID=327061 RepID=UPI002008AB15|nr:heterokaryon incompatibility protein-domain-containing protein [Annulohypoxylon truncatum]KAI1214586.1 heterokaryon incompatibility protein-domain-containing protein [Annulohypoxylon truncatum]